MNKGKNSGKPLQQECVNCFVFLADNQEEQQHFFNLCYALWQGRKFHVLLTGSVIEFIHIDDLRKLLQEASARIKQKQQEYQTILKQINDLNNHQENLQKQIKLITELKKAVIHKLFK
ncbi:MAG TPA: hypothetical protein VNX01_11400 [Bacteroidia bacterium]|nr:hypothetical protein [Bacteroidia bacterium]